MVFLYNMECISKKTIYFHKKEYVPLTEIVLLLPSILQCPSRKSNAFQVLCQYECVSF